jgi:hypothetical protein
MALGCNLVNAAFCAHPLSLSGNSGWYNYPNARWGAAVRYRLRPDLAIRTGLYQVNPRLSEEGNAFRPFAHGTTGVLLPVEVEYDPGAAEGSRVLPGHYKLGVYYDMSRVARQAESGTVDGRYGIYLLADQMVLREGDDGRGLSIFGQFTANPRASAQIIRWYAAGLVKTGTFKGRDSDTIALGHRSRTAQSATAARVCRYSVATARLAGLCVAACWRNRRRVKLWCSVKQVAQRATGYPVHRRSRCVQLSPNQKRVGVWRTSEGAVLIGQAIFGGPYELLNHLRVCDPLRKVRRSNDARNHSLSRNCAKLAASSD